MFVLAMFVNFCNTLTEKMTYCIILAFSLAYEWDIIIRNRNCPSVNLSKFFAIVFNTFKPT